MTPVIVTFVQTQIFFVIIILLQQELSLRYTSKAVIHQRLISLPKLTLSLWLLFSIPERGYCRWHSSGVIILEHFPLLQQLELLFGVEPMLLQNTFESL